MESVKARHKRERKEFKKARAALRNTTVDSGDVVDGQSRVVKAPVEPQVWWQALDMGCESIRGDR